MRTPIYLLTATPAPITVAARLCAGHDSVDYRSRAAYSSLYFNCSKWAIFFTRPTFHAGIQVNDSRLFLINGKNAMRADVNAHSASCAIFCYQLQCNNIFQVFPFHFKSPIHSDTDKRFSVNSKTIPNPIDTAINGIEIFISFITPENEV